MARIVLGSYMVHYPLGGMMSYVLQYLLGFRRLGHDVLFVEKAGYPNACFDPARNVMSDDCAYGVATVGALLAGWGLGDRWCFVDAAGRYHGLAQRQVESAFRTADVFVDMGTHGVWLEEAAQSGRRVLIDGEPAYSQMIMEKKLAAGGQLPRYDFYYTNGLNVGTASCTAPTAGRPWRHLFHPVMPDLFDAPPPPPDAPFTTIMNWQSHDRLEFQGAIYGQKDVEFDKFLSLPERAAAPMQVAVAGKKVPVERLERSGWQVTGAHATTISFESFVSYIGASRGEFSVCKNVFVDTNTGWFSDRSAAYLASGRPVVLQETGFSAHLPVGEGLFAVRTVDAAAAAIQEILGNYEPHAQAAREIAREHLGADRVLGRFLDEIGV
ncbi:MAG: glycosyltransferase [Planctomycetota bacterium]|jgi:hypothetical protein